MNESRLSFEEEMLFAIINNINSATLSCVCFWVYYNTEVHSLPLVLDYSQGLNATFHLFLPFETEVLCGPIHRGSTAFKCYLNSPKTFTEHRIQVVKLAIFRLCLKANKSHEKTKATINNWYCVHLPLCHKANHDKHDYWLSSWAPLPSAPIQNKLPQEVGCSLQ